VPVDQIKDGRGGFVLPGGTGLGYDVLVPDEPVVVTGEAQSANTVPRYALQRKGNYQAIGKKWKHYELEAIVTGKSVYSRDVTLPDMVYGQIIHRPAFAARLKSVNSKVAEAMPGIKVIPIDQGNGFVGEVSFVGVVSADQFSLPSAVEAVEVEWEIPKDLSQDQLDTSLDVARLRASDDFEHVVAEEGDIVAGTGTAKHKVSARYDTPFAAHAAMEPRAALASVRDDKVEIWCGSQDPFFVQKRVATVIGRAVDDVVVHPHRIGGGFGGRVQCHASEEAAILSAAIGRPVRVQWSREAEFQNNYFQPAYSHFINAGINEKGIIAHWEHDFVSSPIGTGPMPAKIGWAADLVVADFGTSRGSLPPYRMANRRIRYSDIRTRVPIGAWRALGAAPNAFAIESMMDELAITAGLDPLELRLNNLPIDEKRLADVLRRVAEISDWGQPVDPAVKDFGRGLACAVYTGKTPVAVVADVVVDHAAKEIHVSKIWCAQDCGLVINPDQVENQVMGNIVWGCSMALKEQLTIKAGRVEQTNFHAYELLRHAESPQMTIALMDSDTAPVGVGESALGPVAPAIANALFAATGRRVRKLPMKYASVFADNQG